MSGSHLSKEFFELVKAIGESKSKTEEDRIIVNEVGVLKRRMTGKDDGGEKDDAATAKKKAKEFLVRLMYVEMLGHDGSFGYIKAVELAASTSIVHKMTGYLTCGACLSPDHEFRFMLVNQLQRDLSSANVLECCAALNGVCRLITVDMVMAVRGEVDKLVAHPSELVRKKAVIALYRLHQLDPANVTFKQLSTSLRRSLCDKDPAVMGATLCVIEKLAIKDCSPFKDLVSSLVSILKQILEHRLPTDYDYHRMPAPWMQMKIVRILSLLGRGDKSASEGMYELLSETMKRADTGINAGYAIVYEVVKAVTVVYPNPTLLDAAAAAIGRFMTSNNHNLRYLGVTGLAAIAKEHPKYAAAHQLAVIDCLESTDETLQRKTLDLLFRMTNPVNVEFVIGKLLAFLATTTDDFLRQDLTDKIVQLAERYAPSNAWYVSSVTRLFVVAGELVPPSVAHNLMAMIAEGCGEDGDDDEADAQLRKDAVDAYKPLLDRPGLPPLLVATMAWVLGEYAYLGDPGGAGDLPAIVAKLCDLARRPNIGAEARRYLATAVMKLVAQAGTCPPSAAHLIDEFTKSRDADLQQRSLEFQNLMTTYPEVLPDVFPVDASCEALDFDENLSFLDGFVKDALARGANAYNPPASSLEDVVDAAAAAERDAHKKPVINITPYARPTAPTSVHRAGSVVDPTQSALGSTGGAAGATPSHQQPAVRLAEPGLRLNGVANVWGPPIEAPPAPAPVPAPAARAPAAAQAASQQLQQPVAAASPAPPTKPKELTEKEKMAMALFGGIASPTTAAPAPSRAPAPAPVAAPSPAPQPVTAPAPATVRQTAAPVQKPSPAASIDLLDMGFDSPASSAPPKRDLPAAQVLDMSSPLASRDTSSLPAAVMDPFASSGLGATSLSDAPLANMLTPQQRFYHKSIPLAPLKVNTAGFGKLWGTCTFTKKVTKMNSTVINSLGDFMKNVDIIGGEGVQAIAQTNEAIAAGQVGADVVLIHCKLSSGGKMDLTVKSIDADLGAACSTFLNSVW